MTALVLLPMIADAARLAQQISGLIHAMADVADDYTEVLEHLNGLEHSEPWTEAEKRRPGCKNTTGCTCERECSNTKEPAK